MSEYNPNRLVELAKQKNILDVAQSLGLELKREGRNYAWIEHPSFKISPDNNYFSWFSKGNELLGADVIKMVEVINNVTFKEALLYLLEAEVGSFDATKVPKKKPFVYRVKEAKTFDYARKYLKEERKLSDETIDFFLSKGLIAQGIHKDYETGKTEPMIVFKHLDTDGNVVGGARQGIWVNKELYGKRGRLKKTLPGSGSTGFVLDIGDSNQFRAATAENPFVIIAFEAPIDLMSYYELYKHKLSNCRLVAMNGLNKGVISRAVLEALVSDKESLKEICKKTRPENYLQKLDDLSTTTGREIRKLKIVLAVDNDQAKFNPKSLRIEIPGKDFIQSFGLKNIPVIPHLAKIHEGQSENDWSDELKYRKEKQKEYEKEEQRTIGSLLSKAHDTLSKGEMESFDF